MQTLTRLAAFSLISLGLLTPAQAKKAPVDFSDFAGSYKGTCTFQFQPDTERFSGTARIKVAVPKNGRSATVTISGLLNAGGTPAPFSNVFVFTGAKSARQQSVLYSISGSPVVGAKGTYKKTKRKVVFHLPFTVEGTFGATNGTMAFHPAGKRKQVLTFTSSADIASPPSKNYLFNFTVSKKVKPKK